MKNKFSLLAALLATASALAAAPFTLTATTAVHTKPDEASPAVSFLKAGTAPVPAAEAPAAVPAGWLAVELSGPFEVYVQNRDIAKSLDVKPGANLYLGPKVESGVLATYEKGDPAEITGLRGRWTQLSLNKKLTGYIRVGGSAALLPPAAITPARTSAPAPEPFAAAPVPPTVYGTTAAGQPAPSVSLSGANGVTLPRLFQGKFVTTRSPFKPRRPYDWALNDDAGSRYAFLDISKLLLTEQIESYLGRMVVVYGAARPTPDGKDIVIEIESLQLK